MKKVPTLFDGVVSFLERKSRPVRHQLVVICDE